MCTGNDCTPRHVTKARKGGKSPEKDCLPQTNNQSRGGLKFLSSSPVKWPEVFMLYLQGVPNLDKQDLTINSRLVLSSAPRCRSVIPYCAWYTLPTSGGHIRT